MQLGTIQDVYTHPGPFVTVHLDVSRNTEDAPQQLDARWTTARQSLEEAGVDTALVDAIGERIHEPLDVPGEVRRTIVAVQPSALCLPSSAADDQYVSSYSSMIWNVHRPGRTLRPMISRSTRSATASWPAARSLSTASPSLRSADPVSWWKEYR